jgi:hypothetical protein
MKEDKLNSKYTQTYQFDGNLLIVDHIVAEMDISKGAAADFSPEHKLAADSHLLLCSGGG